MNRALFLDRDGTLNHDPGYLGNPDLVELYQGTKETLSVLKNKYNFKLFVISNQSGIGRGLISKEQADSVNNKINQLLASHNAEIDKFYYCPHIPEDSLNGKCTCRKPSPELVFKAAEEFDIDLSKSYMIGDKKSDIVCGINASVKTILVKTGYGSEEFSTLQKDKIIPNFVANDFSDILQFIINDFTE